MNPQIRLLLTIGALALVVGGLFVWSNAQKSVTASSPGGVAAYAVTAPDTSWPWPNAKTKELALGVTQTSKVSSDGTMLDLFDFDFGANPKLRWEIFDQDEDDEKPLDNRVNYWNRNVAQMTRQLDGTKKRGAGCGGVERRVFWL